MSSALAMFLTAAMAVPGNGPEKVSGEIEQGLDLSGEWEGISRDYRGKLWAIEVRQGQLVGRCLADGSVSDPVSITRFTDDGKGRFRCNHGDEFPILLGIYRYDGDGLLLCCRQPGEERPREFRGGKGHNLYIIRRVKPRK